MIGKSNDRQNMFWRKKIRISRQKMPETENVFVPHPTNFSLKDPNFVTRLSSACRIFVNFVRQIFSDKVPNRPIFHRPFFNAGPNSAGFENEADAYQGRR